MSLKDLAVGCGCCIRCSLRFAGFHDPKLYQIEPELITCENDTTHEKNNKRFKSDICVCCLGLLQPLYWPIISNILEVDVAYKEYDCEYFACGLSLPVSILLRQHAVHIHLQESFPDSKSDNIVSFKQAWKWTFGSLLAKTIKKCLDSGSVCPFLITFHMIYDDDEKDLNSLKNIAPKIYSEKRKHNKKCTNEIFSRSNIDNVLKNIEVEVFKKHFDCPPKSPNIALKCSKIECCHNSLYFGGRYIKLSRELSQTPWIIDGKKIMENSIQEIIFKPLSDIFKIPISATDSQLKFISSGREDVDVRCLGNGRPFAIEVLNPTITKLSSDQVQYFQILMNSDPNLLKIINLKIIPKEDLNLLKIGEENKSKTYEALCIKLGDTENHQTVSQNNCKITWDDMNVINSFSNMPNGNGIIIKQKTPLRVLHRRPLLNRNRKIFSMTGSCIKDESNIFVLKLTTEAGTYIKEFVHGDFGRTTPNLSQIIGFKVDIIALDVKSVNMEWPIKKCS